VENCHDKGASLKEKHACYGIFREKDLQENGNDNNGITGFVCGFEVIGKSCDDECQKRISEHGAKKH